MRLQMFMLRNLNCPVCAGKVERAVRQLPGMKSAKLAFATGSLTVEYDAEVLSEDKIRETVEGFDAEVAAVVAGPAARD
ncbi:MAG: heavy-metal-associated domain-containing protein [Chloroflexota bacterium]